MSKIKNGRLDQYGKVKALMVSVMKGLMYLSFIIWPTPYIITFKVTINFKGRSMMPSQRLEMQRESSPDADRNTFSQIQFVMWFEAQLPQR